MNNQNPKIKKVLKTLSEGSESLKNDNSEKNRQEWKNKIEHAGSSNNPNWTAIFIIGAVLLAMGFVFIVLSGAAVVAVSNSSTTSNSSHPSGASYYNGHYYMVLAYPSSLSGSGYEATKSYATTTCNNLNGYTAIVSSSEQDFVSNLGIQFSKSNPNVSHFFCEWDN